MVGFSEIKEDHLSAGTWVDISLPPDLRRPLKEPDRALRLKYPGRFRYLPASRMDGAKKSHNLETQTYGRESDNSASGDIVRTESQKAIEGTARGLVSKEQYSGPVKICCQDISEDESEVQELIASFDWYKLITALKKGVSEKEYKEMKRDLIHLLDQKMDITEFVNTCANLSIWFTDTEEEEEGEVLPDSKTRSHRSIGAKRHHFE